MVAFFLIAEPQAKMVMNSLPLPPPVLWTVLSPVFANTLQDATAVQRPVSSQFHNLCLHSLGDSWSIPYFSNNSFKIYAFTTSNTSTKNILKK